MITDHTMYLGWQVSCIFLSKIISSVDFNLSKSLISRSKQKKSPATMRPAYVCHNRPFPSSLVPLFQNESKCKTILMNMSLICMKMKLHAEPIFIWKVSHLDSFWNRGTRELGNGLLDSISLSQKVDLRSLLDLICPSMISEIFSSIFIYSIRRACKLTCIPSLKKYSLWSSCMEYKRNAVWTTTELKDKEIRISYLKYFKISLQISNFRRILARAEFQCVYTT